MKSFYHTITAEHGIHGRPASQLVKLANGFQDSAVTLFCKGKKADAKRIFSVLGLAAGQNDPVSFTVEGGNEDAVLTEFKNFAMAHL